MIGYIEGRVLARRERFAIVLTPGGVGYELELPAPVAAALPAVGGQTALFVHTVVREDALELFGFATLEDRETFRALIGISKLGPRTALSILSQFTTDDLLRVVAAGDRVGAIIFGDEDIQVVRCQRSRKTVMRILQAIVEHNNRLGVDRGIVPAPGKLNEALQKAVSLAGHDYLVCVISDFFGLGDVTLRHATTLARHNDLLLAPVYDPLAQKLPEKGFLVISDGKSQIRLDGHDRQLKERFPEFLQGRLATLSDALHRLGVPVLPLNTVDDVAEQVRQCLGRVPGQPTPPVAVSVEGSR